MPQRLFSLKALPAWLTLMCVAGCCALAAHYVLAVQYGVPAPAMSANQANASLGAQAAPAPSWLAGAATPSEGSSLRLLGVVAQGNQGLALIEAAASRAKVYHVGQTVPGGAVLTAVFEKSAQLLAQGQLQTLTLEGKTSGPLAISSGSVKAPNAAALAINPMAPPVAMPAAAPLPALVDDDERPEPSVPRATPAKAVVKHLKALSGAGKAP